MGGSNEGDALEEGFSGGWRDGSVGDVAETMVMLNGRSLSIVKLHKLLIGG
jgi:hypothetical protein